MQLSRTSQDAKTQPHLAASRGQQLHRKPRLEFSKPVAPFPLNPFPRRLSPIMPQDMPPTGGYEPVQYKRNLPARGFRPATYLLMVGAVCTYGFWRVGQGIREQKYA